jgi:NAD(P)-dependent dehydrogenase (short-subunit alcohol dehydrogenase family)
MSFHDVALVTGAGSGTGAATTARLRSRGIPVVGVGRRAEPTILPVASGAAPLHWLSGDAADPAVLAGAVEIARRELGAPPSILVTSAARLEVGTVLTLPVDEWQRTFDLNVFGLVHALRAVLPAMIERHRGAIVTVGSIDSLFAEQGLVSYCASKGAILQITRTVAVDYARDGIRANCVIMGVTDTPFFRRHLDTASDPDRFVKVREERQPLGRLLTPDEIAATIVFLASDDASGITGAAIPVDAGITTSFDFRTGGEGA